MPKLPGAVILTVNLGLIIPGGLGVAVFRKAPEAHPNTTFDCAPTRTKQLVEEQCEKTDRKEPSDVEPMVVFQPWEDQSSSGDTRPVGPLTAIGVCAGGAGCPGDVTPTSLTNVQTTILEGSDHQETPCYTTGREKDQPTAPGIVVTRCTRVHTQDSSGGCKCPSPREQKTELYHTS